VRTCLEAGARGYLLKNAMDLGTGGRREAGGLQARAYSTALGIVGRIRRRGSVANERESRYCS